jgi:hypothetical protein
MNKVYANIHNFTITHDLVVGNAEVYCTMQRHRKRKKTLVHDIRFGSKLQHGTPNITFYKKKSSSDVRDVTKCIQTDVQTYDRVTLCSERQL